MSNKYLCDLCGKEKIAEEFKLISKEICVCIMCDTEGKLKYQKDTLVRLLTPTSTCRSCGGGLKWMGSYYECDGCPYYFDENFNKIEIPF